MNIELLEAKFSPKEEQEILAQATESTIWAVTNGLDGNYKLFDEWERILRVLGW